MTAGARYLVGGYTPPHGEAGGVALLERARDGWTTRVVADVPSPSFLARHPQLPIVYAVAEHRAELVVLELSRDGAARVVQEGIPAGAAACHVRIAADGGSAVVACWGDGTVLRYALDARGRVIARTPGAPVEPSPTGAASRAHASLAVPGGFVTTDLGRDLIRVWADEPSGIREVQRLELPSGCGPRHLVGHPNGRLYVVTEFSVEILELARDPEGVLVLAGRAPARPGGRREGDTGAEIALDPTGGWLTVGVRGSDRIAASRVEPGGGTVAVAEAPSGGIRPRHHLHDPAGVLVANQSSSTVVRIPFDAVRGAFGDPAEAIAVPTPTFLLPL